MEPGKDASVPATTPSASIASSDLDYGPREEFSFRSREKVLKRFREETFDLLIIGGGITGAGVARDAVRRGLKVALVERSDFAFGTSSRSSKLVHGGLRYLENLEFGLVFEALSERANLLKTAPHMVKPLKFYFPVYQGDPTGRFTLALGMWLYDVLSLFRAPGFHKSLSRRRMLRELPFLKKAGLQGGFSYYDASMWDDVMAIEVLRSAYESGAAVANYMEATTPLWTGERITGFKVRDLEGVSRGEAPGEEFEIRARQVVVCAGPWTDVLGQKMSQHWREWLTPSKGVHLIFDLKRIPVPGAVVMSHPADGRISFVIPRPDFGSGVVVVGTTDSPSPVDPAKAEVSSEDIDYLLELLNRYFPDLKLSASDILSAYVGVRPLAAGPGVTHTADGQANTLQKVSREHHIDRGPGGTTIVAGGKYTTYRRMAEEVVDFMLAQWREAARQSQLAPPPSGLKPARTREPMNPRATQEAMAHVDAVVRVRGISVPSELLHRFGADALQILELAQKTNEDAARSPSGFPFLETQLRHAIRTEMAMHLTDFYFRRLPLFASRVDHGLPWAERLSRILAEERGLSEAQRQAELERLHERITERSAWQKRLISHGQETS